MVDKQNIKEILEYIDPALLDYSEWCSVDMALIDAGYTAADWDSWSRKDLQQGITQPQIVKKKRYL